MSAIAVPTLAELLRAVYPQHTAKRTAALGGLSYRTVQDWLQRRCCPSADTLLRLAAENEELRAELLRRLGGHGFAGSDLVQSGAALASKVATPSSVAVDEQGRRPEPAAETDAAVGRARDAAIVEKAAADLGRRRGERRGAP